MCLKKIIEIIFHSAASKFKNLNLRQLYQLTFLLRGFQISSVVKTIAKGGRTSNSNNCLIVEWSAGGI